MPIKRRKAPIQEPVDQEESWGQSKAETEKKELPIGWRILLFTSVGGLLLSIFGLFIWQTFFGNKRANEARDKAALEQYVEAGAELEAYANLHVTLDSFFHAQSIDDLLAISRHPDRVRPLMEDYYASHPLPSAKSDDSEDENKKPEQENQGVSPFSIDAVTPVSAGSSSDDRKGLVLVRVKKNNSVMNFLMEEDKNEQYLIDWESHVVYQPMSWNDFIENRHSGPVVFRVFCAIDHYYPYEFSNDEKYQSYGLIAKGSNQGILGFAQRGSSADMMLKKILRPEAQLPRREPFIIKLRFPKKKSESKDVYLVHIDEVLVPGWTYLTNPDE